MTLPDVVVQLAVVYPSVGACSIKKYIISRFEDAIAVIVMDLDGNLFQVVNPLISVEGRQYSSLVTVKCYVGSRYTCQLTDVFSSYLVQSTRPRLHLPPIAGLKHRVVGMLPYGKEWETSQNE